MEGMEQNLGFRQFLKMAIDIAQFYLLDVHSFNQIEVGIHDLMHERQSGMSQNFILES